MGLAQLPSELQIHIFSYLDRLSLKAIRGVSTKFRDNASPELFRQALACARYQALSTLQKLSLHPIYHTYVKEILFDGSVYDPNIAKNEGRYHQLADERPELAHGFLVHKRQRWKRYRELYLEQEEMRNDGVLIATISRALEWMRNVTSIVYSPGPHDVPLEARTVRDLLPRGSLDKGYPIVPAQDYMHSTQHGIHHLIGAIYEAQCSGIRTFRVETVDEQQPSGTEFTIAVFDFPDVVHLEAGKYFFSHLHNLDLNLSLGSSGGTGMSSGNRGLTQLANLAALLEETQQLETLSFHLCHWRTTAHQMYGHIIPHSQPLYPYLGLYATWPKLRSLSLGGIYATEEELIDLVERHKATLKELKFRSCSLFSGYWANIVDNVVNTTNIIPFSLDCVNETEIGERQFHDLTGEEMDHWEYEGCVLVDSEGQRYFDEPNHKSVYTNRSRSLEERRSES